MIPVSHSHSLSSQDRLDLEEFSLRQHIERLTRELALNRCRLQVGALVLLEEELQNYQRRLVLYQENRTYESRRRARRQKLRLRVQQRSRP